MRLRLPWVLACLGIFACSDDGSGAEGGGQTGSSSTGVSSGPTDGETTAGSSGAGTSASSGLSTSTDGSGDSTSGDDTGSSDSGDDETTTTTTTTTGDDSTGGDDSTALHVAEFGQNSNPGTPDEPMRTIQWAIAQADMNPEIDTVRVATGTYEADVANDASIVMIEGVSMLGGWNEDFDARDPQAWPTDIVDSSAVAPVGTAEFDPAYVVNVPEDVTEDTVFDGFRVEIGRGQHRAGVQVEGNATISGNSFSRGTDTNAVIATAVFVRDGDPRISGNRIELDYDETTSQVRGITVLNGDPMIANNVISLAGATYAHHGIDLNGASPDIVGNSIEFHDAPNIYVLRLVGLSQPRIDNNVLQASDGSGVCIASLSPTATPLGLRNNLLQCQYATWGNGTSSVGQWESIAQVHAGIANASGNVKLAGPLVSHTDGLMLDGDTPCSVARGGLDLTDELEDDVAGQARTAPLSMGAHEWDGGCQ